MNDSLKHLITDAAGRNPLVDQVMRWLAQDLVYGVAALAGLVCLWLVVTRASAQGVRLGVALTGAVLLALAVGMVLHRVINQPRPFVAEPDSVRLLIDHAATPSMPSNHALFTFAIAGTLLWWTRWAGAIALVAAILIGIARVYVGVHWPADVLAGALIGLMAGALAAVLLQRWPIRERPRFRRVPESGPG